MSMKLNFTEDHLQDLILVLGVEKGLEEFLQIVEYECLLYLNKVGPRYNEIERKYILTKLGYE